MSERRICGRFRTIAPLAVGAFLVGTALSAQAPPATNNVAGNSLTRPCGANPVLAPAASKKSSHKSKPPSSPEPPPVCIEAKGEGIEVQEFLQNTAREQTWRLGENRSSEDAWSFVRYFNPDELEKFADINVLIEPVKFTSGKAAVIVRTTDLPDHYTRVQISAHFQAEGKSTDKTWAQPTSQWSLASKGVLERELISALQTRYKPLE